MSRTKTYDDTRESIFFDRMLLISKFKRLGIEDKITEILESHEIMEYYEVHLVERVRKWSNAFMTKSARDYFNQAISRENLMLNVRTNIENNLLSNALTYWLKIDCNIEEVIKTLLTPAFVKHVIDVLAREFENLEYEIKQRESEGFNFGTVTNNNPHPIN